MLYESLTQAIGNTPLVHFTKFDPSGNLYAKLEMMNPGSSAKDRAALFMLESAVREGRLASGGIVVEPTSGNTGVGLAWLCAIYGYKLILTMPETMSLERRKILAAYGAKIVLTPGERGMAGAIEEASRIVRETGAFMPQQFENAANPAAHENTTGPEIVRDMAGEIGALICTVGTGGTITGVARAVKKACPNAKIIAVEPDASAVLSGGKAGPHKIQGIGAGFIPAALDVRLIDRVMTVSWQDAYDCARRAAKSEGVLCGISSGAALYAAKKAGIARSVVVLPDSGERYLSTDLFEV